MPANEIHVGDIGTILTVVFQDNGTIVDISTATTKDILLTDPDGTKTTNAGVFVTDGTDGAIKYVSVAATFGRAGNWKIQGYVVLPGVGEWHTDISTFVVHGNL